MFEATREHEDGDHNAIKNAESLLLAHQTMRQGAIEVDFFGTDATEAANISTAGTAGLQAMLAFAARQAQQQDRDFYGEKFIYSYPAVSSPPATLPLTLPAFLGAWPTKQEEAMTAPCPFRHIVFGRSQASTNFDDNVQKQLLAFLAARPQLTEFSLRGQFKEDEIKAFIAKLSQANITTFVNFVDIKTPELQTQIDNAVLKQRRQHNQAAWQQNNSLAAATVANAQNNNTTPVEWDTRAFPASQQLSQQIGLEVGMQMTMQAEQTTSVATAITTSMSVSQQQTSSSTSGELLEKFFKPGDYDQLVKFHLQDIVGEENVTGATVIAFLENITGDRNRPLCQGITISAAARLWQHRAALKNGLMMDNLPLGFYLAPSRWVGGGLVLCYDPKKIAFTATNPFTPQLTRAEPAQFKLRGDYRQFLPEDTTALIAEEQQKINVYLNGSSAKVADLVEGFWAIVAQLDQTKVKELQSNYAALLKDFSTKHLLALRNVLSQHGVGSVITLLQQLQQLKNSDPQLFYSFQHVFFDHSNDFSELLTSENQALLTRLSQLGPAEKAWWLALTNQTAVSGYPNSFTAAAQAYFYFLEQLASLKPPLRLPRTCPLEGISNIPVALDRLWYLVKNADNPQEQLDACYANILDPREALAAKLKFNYHFVTAKMRVEQEVYSDKFSDFQPNDGWLASNIHIRIADYQTKLLRYIARQRYRLPLQMYQTWFKAIVDEVGQELEGKISLAIGEAIERGEQPLEDNEIYLASEDTAYQTKLELGGVKTSILNNLARFFVILTTREQGLSQPEKTFNKIADALLNIGDDVNKIAMVLTLASRALADKSNIRDIDIVPIIEFFSDLIATNDFAALYNQEGGMYEAYHHLFIAVEQLKLFSPRYANQMLAYLAYNPSFQIKKLLDFNAELITLQQDKKFTMLAPALQQKLLASLALADTNNISACAQVLLQLPSSQLESLLDNLLTIGMSKSLSEPLLSLKNTKLLTQQKKFDTNILTQIFTPPAKTKPKDTSRKQPFKFILLPQRPKEMVTDLNWANDLKNLQEILTAQTQVTVASGPLQKMINLVTAGSSVTEMEVLTACVAEVQDAQADITAKGKKSELELTGIVKLALQTLSASCSQRSKLLLGQLPLTAKQQQNFLQWAEAYLAADNIATLEDWQNFQPRYLQIFNVLYLLRQHNDNYLTQTVIKALLQQLTGADPQLTPEQTQELFIFTAALLTQQNLSVQQRAQFYQLLVLYPNNTDRYAIFNLLNKGLVTIESELYQQLKQTRPPVAVFGAINACYEALIAAVKAQAQPDENFFPQAIATAWLAAVIKQWPTQAEDLITHLTQQIRATALSDAKLALSCQLLTTALQKSLVPTEFKPDQFKALLTALAQKDEQTLRQYLQFYQHRPYPSVADLNAIVIDNNDNLFKQFSEVIAPFGTRDIKKQLELEKVEKGEINTQLGRFAQKAPDQGLSQAEIHSLAAQYALLAKIGATIYQKPLPELQQTLSTLIVLLRQADDAENETVLPALRQHLVDLLGQQEAEKLLTAVGSIEQKSLARLLILAYLREIYYRVSPPEQANFANSTQMLVALHSINQPGNVVAGVNTGEGKTLITALQAGLLWAEGQSVDITSHQLVYAERDFQRNGDFFTAIGVEHCAVISAHSAVEDYHDGGIHYTTFDDIALFDARKALMATQAPAGAAPGAKRSKRVMLNDEQDANLFDNTKQLNLSRNLPGVTGTHNPYEWMYPLVNNFIDFVEGDTATVDLSRYFTETKKIDGKYSELQEVLALKKYLAANAPAGQAELLAAPGFHEKLHSWLLAGRQARELKNVAQEQSQDGYLIEELTETLPNGAEETYSYATIVQNNRPKRGSSWENGTQQLLHARLNRHLKNGQPAFKIMPETEKVASTNTRLVTLAYDRIIGDTASLGGKTELAELAAPPYNFKIFAYPSHQVSQRQDDEPEYFTDDDNAEAQMLDRLVTYVSAAQRTGQPILISCQDTVTAKKIADKLRTARIADLNLQLLTAENIQQTAEIVQAAGEKNTVTISTLLERGTDIKTNHADGLYVINVGIANSRTLQQTLGRTARFGNAGRTKILIVLKKAIEIVSATVETLTGSKILTKEQAKLDKSLQTQRLLTQEPFIVKDLFLQSFLQAQTQYQAKQAELLQSRSRYLRALETLWQDCQLELAARPDHAALTDRQKLNYLMDNYITKAEALWQKAQAELAQVSGKPVEPGTLRAASVNN